MSLSFSDELRTAVCADVLRDYVQDGEDSGCNADVYEEEELHGDMSMWKPVADTVDIHREVQSCKLFEHAEIPR